MLRTAVLLLALAIVPAVSAGGGAGVFYYNKLGVVVMDIVTIPAFGPIVDEFHAHLELRAATSPHPGFSCLYDEHGRFALAAAFRIRGPAGPTFSRRGRAGGQPTAIEVVFAGEHREQPAAFTTTLVIA